MNALCWDWERTGTLFFLNTPVHGIVPPGSAVQFPPFEGNCDGFWKIQGIVEDEYLRRGAGQISRLFLHFISKFEADPEDAVVVIGGENPEDSDLACRFDVTTDAGAGVIVTDPDNANAIAGFLGEALKIECRFCFSTREEFLPDAGIRLYHLVDAAFDLEDLVRGQCAIKMVVAFSISCARDDC